MNWKMKKIIIVILLIFASGILKAQYGSLAVFENGTDGKVKFVRIFPVKCTVTEMKLGAYSNLEKSVNAYMNLDGTRVYTKFFIPFTGYDGAKEFALKEYFSKKDAKLVTFIRESEVILLDENGNVVSSKTEEKPLGTLIAYYKNAVEVYQWSAWEIWGKKLPKTPGELARQYGGDGAKGGVMITEWKPGIDWYAAENVARSNSSRYAIPGTYKAIAVDDFGRNQLSLKQTGYTEKEQNNIKQGKQPDGEKIDFTKEDYIDNLPPDMINKLKSYFRDEQEKLLRNGWVRFFSKYDYAPYQYDQFAFSGRMDKSYTLILVSDDTAAQGHVYSRGQGLAKQVLGPNKYVVYYDLYSPTEKRSISAFVESMSKKKIPFGVIAFRREPKLQSDLAILLIDAETGFSSYKMGLLTNRNGKDIFSGESSLGHLHAEVFFNTSLSKWEYTVYTEWDDDVVKLKEELNSFLLQREKFGQYIIRRREEADKSILYMDVYDKAGNLILNTEEQTTAGKKHMWTFYEQTKK